MTQYYKSANLVNRYHILIRTSATQLDANATMKSILLLSILFGKI